MHIQLLGGVRASSNDGASLDVGPAKCQIVLAALSLAAGSAVPVTRLVELVWGEDPPRTAAKTVQTYIARLRKGLGPDTIVRLGASYRLDVQPDSVDALRFQTLLDRGNTAAALAEWTGAPLAGLDSHGLAATVVALVEQYLGAVEVDLEAVVEANPPAAIGPLTELTSTYPFRESLWALLMTSLYRAGRQSDALAAYRTARSHLVEQLGVEPGPRLRALESSILDHDERLDDPRSTRGSSPEPPSGTVTFGFCEVEDAERLWSTHRLEMTVAAARLDELVRAAAADQRGRVWTTAGGAFGVAFHRAADAVRWADQLHTTAREPWPGAVALRLRVGVHTGETEERGREYFGPAVEVAKRLADAAHGGQTLVSGVTAALLDHVDLQALGSFLLEGTVTEQLILQLGDHDHPPLRIDAGRRGNLPRRSDRLIGREEQLDTTAEALTTAPIVTLVGPGGIGKTRFALAVAHRSATEFEGGTWWVELGLIGSPKDVPRAVADALDVKENATRTLTESIVLGLGSRHALLVLDNCEHVIDGAAALAHAVAEGCPHTRVLTTSREALNVAHEQLIGVPPLEPAGAGVELFNERAAAADRAFDPDTSRSDVEEICRRLDGVPLAIELAAARTRSLSPPEVLERLDDHLRLLTGGRRVGVERHRTLRATIQWSYDLLTTPEQVVFNRISIFAGAFDHTAAAAVTADESLADVDVDDLLSALVERSMLISESGPFGRRLRQLESIRQFGAERLFEAGQTELIAVRHAQWCLDKVTIIHGLLNGRAEIEGAARLGELWVNLRAAVDWACATRHYELAHALVRPVASEVLLRSQSEICDWYERILEITPAKEEELIVSGLTWAAHRYMQNRDPRSYQQLVDRYGEPDRPETRYARAFANDNNERLLVEALPAAHEFRARGEEDLAGISEVWFGGALLGTGRFTEHDTLMAELEDRYRAHGPPTLLSWVLLMSGFSASFQGNQTKAEQFFEDSINIDVPDSTPSLSKPIEARSALRRGNRPQAFRVLRSFIDDLLEFDMMSGTTFACIEFINMMTGIDRPDDAARVLGYLRTTGLLETNASPFSQLVADAANKLATRVAQRDDRHREPEPTLDERQTLAYMRRVLEQLLDIEHPTHLGQANDEVRTQT
ncbi:MAG: BTAD domain-containing putative transcriptional regulator [Ornithinimicrobium sp.]